MPSSSNLVLHSSVDSLRSLTPTSAPTSGAPTPEPRAPRIQTPARSVPTASFLSQTSNVYSGLSSEELFADNRTAQALSRMTLENKHRLLDPGASRGLEVGSSSQERTAIPVLRNALNSSETSGSLGVRGTSPRKPISTSATPSMTSLSLSQSRSRSRSGSPSPSDDSEDPEDQDDEDDTRTEKDFAEKSFTTPAADGGSSHHGGNNGKGFDGEDDGKIKARPSRHVSLFGYGNNDPDESAEEGKDEVEIARPVQMKRWRSNTVRSDGSDGNTTGFLTDGGSKGKGKARMEEGNGIAGDVAGTAAEGGLFEDGRSMAESLPPEILAHVLKYLTSSRDIQSALLVSSTWCQVVVPTIWARPSLVRKSTIHRLIRVLRSPNPTFEYPSLIKRFNVISLQTTLTDPQFLEFSACVRIERMTLTGSRHLTEEALCTVLSKMPRMVALDLTGVVQTTDKVLRVIADTNERLQGINLTDCSQVTDEGVAYLAGKAKLLRRVKLTNCSRLTDIAITAVAENCPLVLELDVQGIEQMTDDSMFDIWLHNSHLRELQLSGNDKVTDAGFPVLKDLGGERFIKSSDAAAAAGNAWKGQQQNQSPQPDPVKRLRIRSPPVALTFVHLRKVKLNGCTEINDKAIEALVTNAKKISTLTLSRCAALTDAALESVSKLGSRLHYLHMGHCNLITDVGVTKLARACSRIRYLDLACCTLLTDMSIFEIAASMSKLNRIGLVKVNNITDAAIYALAERRSGRNSKLTRVHLSYCENLTMKSVAFLLMRLPYISHLSLTGVRNMRTPEYQRFCKPAPKEFNEHQRAAFCVFSGKNVGELREYLLSQIEIAPHSPSQYSNEAVRGSHGRDRDRYRDPTIQSPSPVGTSSQLASAWDPTGDTGMGEVSRNGDNATGRRPSAQLRNSHRAQWSWLQRSQGLPNGNVLPGIPISGQYSPDPMGSGTSNGNGVGASISSNGSNSPNLNPNIDPNNLILYAPHESLTIASLHASMQGRTPQFFPDSAIGRSQARGDMVLQAPVPSPLGERDGSGLAYVDSMLRDVEERDRDRQRQRRRSEEEGNWRR